MEIQGEDHSRKDRFSAFWERMAQHYPLPFEDKTLADTRRVLSLVKNKGVEFSKTSVLDIGMRHRYLYPAIGLRGGHGNRD